MKRNKRKGKKIKSNTNGIINTRKARLKTFEKRKKKEKKNRKR